MKYQKYKVVSAELTETFDSEQMAKRAYGIIKRRLKYRETSFDSVELYFKPLIDSDWQILLSFYIGDIGTRKVMMESFDPKNECDELDNSL